MTAQFKKGDRVRVTGLPFRGWRGTVISVDGVFIEIEVLADGRLRPTLYRDDELELVERTVATEKQP